MTQNFGCVERNAISGTGLFAEYWREAILALLYERKEQHTAFQMNHIICRA